MLLSDFVAKIAVVIFLVWIVLDPYLCMVCDVVVLVLCAVLLISLLKVEMESSFRSIELNM